MSTGVWTSGTTPGELGHLRASLTRQAFAAWTFWFIVGRHRWMWFSAAYFLFIRTPYRLFLFRRGDVAWGWFDTAIPAIAIGIPLLAYLYGLATYGRLSRNQQVVDVALRQHGIDATSSAEVRHVGWDQVRLVREGAYGFYVTGTNGFFMFIPKLEPADPASTSQLRGILIDRLGERAKVKAR